MATAGFVTALVGAVLALIPFVGVVSWVISPAGLALSIFGLVTAKRHRGVGRGLGIAGVCLGALGLLICIIYAAAFAAALSEPPSAQQLSTPNAYQSSPSTRTGIMPNFVGSVAQSAADQLSSSPGIPTVFVTGGAAGRGKTVIAQTPAPGTTITADTRVELTVELDEPSVPTPSATGPATTFGAGTYAVGSEVAAGTYSTSGGSYCYWARLKAADGEFSSMITNNIVTGQSTMTIKETDKYVEFTGDCTWTRK